jgi:hypothetical protein
VTIDELFLATVDDLESRVPLRRGEYDALMSAGLLRKLLLDRWPLIDQVNRPPTRQLDISYEVVDQRPPPAAYGWMLNGGLYPDAHRRQLPTVALTRGEFLRCPVLGAFGETFTVRELIKFMANVHGAVHAGKPRSRKEEALAEFVQGTRLTVHHGSYSGGIHDLAGIGKITLAAVSDLRQIVEKESGCV